MFTRHHPLHRPSPYPSWFVPTHVFILPLVLILSSRLLLRRWFLRVCV